MLKDLVVKNRSYRRFYETERITREQLERWVDNARLTASGANAQPVRYKLVFEQTDTKKVFATLGWAAYYKDWDGPVEGERPTAYILLALPEGKNAQYDEGIEAQTILLSAVEEGFGGCLLRNVDFNCLHESLPPAAGYRYDLVIALGKPKEICVTEDVKNDNIRYYRDENQVQHVPKRTLRELLM